MFFALFLIPFVSAASFSNRHENHAHSVHKRLPGTWFQHRDHPVHALFKRADAADAFPQVGTPEWFSRFPALSSPPATPDTTKLPAEWVAALNAAVAAGSIPDIPQSTGPVGTNPVYPTGFDPNGPEICSATYKCKAAGDYWDVPDGFFGTSFDDGPTDITPKLLDFLKANNEQVTHFMIGVNILGFPNQFLAALNSGGDLAVHTWSHPQMTKKNNLEVVAEFGWTMQIIHDSSGGRVPKFYRPPTGDTDNRVRAIAKEVFGLETVLWNYDTEDWSLTTGGTTPEEVSGNLTQWITGAKSPGLMILEHEHSDPAVDAFIAAYPLIKANGWKIASVARLLDGTSAYRNADGPSGAVTPAGILDFKGSSDSDSNQGSIVGQTAASQTASQTTKAAINTGTFTKSTTTSPLLDATQSSSAVRLWSERTIAWTAALLAVFSFTI